MNKESKQEEEQTSEEEKLKADEHTEWVAPEDAVMRIVQRQKEAGEETSPAEVRRVYEAMVRDGVITPPNEGEADIEENVARVYRWRRPDDSDQGYGYHIQSMDASEIETVLTYVALIKQKLISDYQKLMEIDKKEREEKEQE